MALSQIHKVLIDFYSLWKILQSQTRQTDKKDLLLTSAARGTFKSGHVTQASTLIAIGGDALSSVRTAIHKTSRYLCKRNNGTFNDHL